MNAELNVSDCLFLNESGILTAQFFKITKNSKANFQNVSLKVNFFLNIIYNVYKELNFN